MYFILSHLRQHNQCPLSPTIIHSDHQKVNPKRNAAIPWFSHLLPVTFRLRQLQELDCAINVRLPQCNESQLILLIFFCFSKQRCQEKCFNHPRLSNSMWIVHTDRRKHLISINWNAPWAAVSFAGDSVYCQLCKQTWTGEYRDSSPTPFMFSLTDPSF